MKVNIFCPFCGQKVVANTERTFVFCNDCGSRIQLGSSFTTENNISTEHYEYSVSNTTSVIPSMEKRSINDDYRFSTDTGTDSAPTWTIAFGIAALVFAIISWFAEPWWMTLVVGSGAIGLAIVSLVKKWKLKGLSVAAIPVAGLAITIAIIIVGMH